MTVTREQVADLQPGDVVEFRHPKHPAVVTRGPVEESEGNLWLGDEILIRGRSGDPGVWRREGELTVIERAPRPFYVNHPRSEPVPGDVVRNADEDGALTWIYAYHGDIDRRPWFCAGLTEWWSRESLPKRLRLLVDGETGQVVT